MNKSDKYLYHQIHPLKLVVDWLMAITSLYFFWTHQIFLGLTILFIPPIIATVLIIRFVSLEKQKFSSFGRYIATSMTKPVQGVRFLGMFIMVIGAWSHFPLVILGGLAVILLAWCYGLIRSRVS